MKARLPFISSSVFRRYFLIILILALACFLLFAGLALRISSGTTVDLILRYEIRETVLAQRELANALEHIEAELSSETLRGPQFRGIPPGAREDYGPILAELERMKQLRDATRLIESVYVAFPEGRFLASTEDGYWRWESFYDRAGAEALSAEPNVWTPVRRIRTTYDAELRLVSFALPFAGAPGAGTHPFLAVNVEGNKIRSVLKEAIDDQDGEFYIFDRFGTLISGGREEEAALISAGMEYSEAVGAREIDSGGRRLLASYAKMPSSGWTVLRVRPVEESLGPVRAIQATILILIAFFMLIILTTSYLAALQLFRPIRSTLEAVPGMAPGAASDDEFAHIRRTILELSQRNAFLSRTLDTETRRNRAAALADLIAGRIGTAEWQTHLGGSGLDLHRPRFLLVLAVYETGGIDGGDLLDRVIASLDGAPGGLVEGVACLPVPLGSGKIMLLLNYDTFDFRTKIPRMKSAMDDAAKERSTVNVSHEFFALEELPDAYDEVMVGYNLSYFASRPEVAFSETDRDGQGAPGSSVWENEILLNGIRHGDADTVLRLLEGEANSLLRSGAATNEDFRHLFLTAFSAVWDAVRRNGWSRREVWGYDYYTYAKLLSRDTLESSMHFFREFMNQLAPFLAAGKTQKENSIVAECKRIMQASLSEPIALSSIAERMKISAPYLSRLFKKETGENFVHYLTDLRIERSKELLRTNMPLKEIAEAVQLGNVQNYIRIFKRHIGTTPGAFRKDIKENEAR